MARHGYLREYDEEIPSEERERALRGEDRDRRFLLDRGDRYREVHGPEHGYGGSVRGRAGFEPDPDEHYRSWRDSQVRAMDRDYEEYRREREQEFHSDFEAWRQQRHANPQPLQTGMTQTGLSDTTGTLELTSPTPVETPTGPDPTATATLGTTSSGRRRRG